MRNERARRRHALKHVLKPLPLPNCRLKTVKVKCEPYVPPTITPWDKTAKYDKTSLIKLDEEKLLAHMQRHFVVLTIEVKLLEVKYYPNSDHVEKTYLRSFENTMKLYKIKVPKDNFIKNAISWYLEHESRIEKEEACALLTRRQV